MTTIPDWAMKAAEEIRSSDHAMFHTVAINAMAEIVARHYQIHTATGWNTNPWNIPAKMDVKGIDLALAEVERLCNFAYPCIASNREDPACPHEDSWTVCFLEAFRKWAKVTK